MIKKGRNIMIDIHMHTIYSDGDKTVEEVLKMCEAKKLEYIYQLQTMILVSSIKMKLFKETFLVGRLSKVQNCMLYFKKGILKYWHIR